MNTYPTYQAAKIDNPESNIYSLQGKFYPEGTATRPDENWIFCQTADYCITQEQFLDAGYDLEDGDIILTRCGEVIYINHWTLAEFGVLNSSSHKTYILKAKALEERNTILTEISKDKELPDTVAHEEWEVWHGESWKPCIRFGKDIYNNYAYQISGGEFEGEFNGTPSEDDFRKPESPEAKRMRFK